VAEFFNRFWELSIKSNPVTQTKFEYIIKQDEFGQSLRMNFDITAAIDIRYYQGTIKIYNLDPSKRKSLVFNILGNDFGTGPSIKLVVGYETNAGIIMDGVVRRGWTVRRPLSGDFITVLECGTSLSSGKNVTIQSVKVINSNLLTHVKNWLSIIIPVGGVTDKDNRFIIKRAQKFDENLSNAVDLSIAEKKGGYNTKFGASGPAAKVLNEITKTFGLVFYYDNEGFNVRSPTLSTELPEIQINKDTGMIGSPIYTDTGTKVLSYLRADYRLFQPVNIKSSVLEKTVKITTLIHRGDTHSSGWYSEIDANNLGNLIV